MVGWRMAEVVKYELNFKVGLWVGKQILRMTESQVTSQWDLTVPTHMPPSTHTHWTLVAGTANLGTGERGPSGWASRPPPPSLLLASPLPQRPLSTLMVCHPLKLVRVVSFSISLILRALSEERRNAQSGWKKQKSNVSLLRTIQILHQKELWRHKSDFKDCSILFPHHKSLQISFWNATSLPHHEWWCVYFCHNDKWWL